MLFNSYIFVLLFLPSCLAGYFALNHFRFERGASYFLLGMSLWFYAYFNIKYLPIILFSICFNFFFHRLLCHTRRFSVRKTALCAAVLFNLGLLFYFKYYDFFFSNVNLAFGSSFVLKHLVLPLGISFFTFQQISLVIDTYWGETAEYGFLDYALFVSYFPQLIAGPIVTHQELIPQFQDPEKRKLNWDNFSRGLYLFALGMGKKVILADTFGNAVNWGFNNIGSLDTINGGLIMLSYTFQIYFDFSGYCDMASGIAKMMNIDLPLNSLKFQIAIQSLYNHRVLGTLAHYINPVFYPIRLYSSGRQSGKCAADIPQHHFSISRKRSLARSKLDLRHLGRTPWCFCGDYPPFSSVF